MRTVAFGLAVLFVLAGCLSGTPSGTVSPMSSDAPTTAPGSSTDGPAEPRSRTDGPADPHSTTDGGPDESTTTDVETNAPATPCQEHRMETVDPVRTAVTPSPLPDRPENLTRETVEAYVRAYERAYRRNIGLEENTKTYEVSVSEVTVREDDGTFVVTVNAKYWYNAGGPAEGTATATIIHADGPYYTAVYTVSDHRLRRDSDVEDDTAKRGNGPVLECWS